MADPRGPRREGRWRGVAVEVLEHGVPPRVVHYRVELRAVEPADGVVPDLSDDEGIGLGALDAIAERTPEAVVDLVRDVEPPAVDVRLENPLFADAAEVLAQPRVRGVQLGVVADAIRERLVVHRSDVDREAVDLEEPISVTALGPMLADVAESEPFVAGVVEDAVEQDADAGGVRFPGQRC